VGDRIDQTFLAAEEGEGFMDLTDPGFPQYHGLRGGASNLHVFAIISQSSIATGKEYCDVFFRSKILS
jgi:hypothetical protein